MLTTRRIWFVALAGYAVAVRAVPLLTIRGAHASASFDAGVYLSGAGLLSQGHVPYKDFVFLHPPGILLLAWPLAATHADWGTVLVASRWLAVAVGAVNVVLLAHVVSRWRGLAAGVVAAGLYASYSPVVGVEQQLLLEPFVVLFVLTGAALWLSERRARIRVGGAGAAFAFRRRGQAHRRVRDPRAVGNPATAAVQGYGRRLGLFSCDYVVLGGTDLERSGRFSTISLRTFRSRYVPVPGVVMPDSSLWRRR